MHVVAEELRTIGEIILACAAGSGSLSATFLDVTVNAMMFGSRSGTLRGHVDPAIQIHVTDVRAARVGDKKRIAHRAVMISRPRSDTPRT